MNIPSTGTHGPRDKRGNDVLINPSADPQGWAGARRLYPVGALARPLLDPSPPGPGNHL